MTYPISLHEQLEKNVPKQCLAQKDLAVAVSGGADSMALCHALAHFLAPRDIILHVLSVDHGLRLEAAKEVEHVEKFTATLPGDVRHYALKWQYEQKPETRIQETARTARYELMCAVMKTVGAKYLFLGHHRDDQAETFLFRLSKGSGLDGLACMAAVQEHISGITQIRPLLGVGKGDLVEYCKNQGIPCVSDPSNEDESYARVRLRKGMTVLEQEGITSKRLATTAKRLARAREALEMLSEKAYKEAILEKDTIQVVLNFNYILNQPFDIALRVVLLAIKWLSFQDCPENGNAGSSGNGALGGYGVRLERVEALCTDLVSNDPFRKRTLGGVIFERDDKAQTVRLSAEKPAG